MTDINALKERIRALKISGWIRFFISAACFWFVFSRSISWLTWVLLGAALIFLSLSLAAVGGKNSANQIFDLVTMGEFSIPILAEKLKQKEEHVRRNILELIRIGVFPGATIADDKIRLADIQQDTHSTENNVPILSESVPIQKIDLNTASEQELAELPGVGVVLAKRAVEMRAQIIGFTSAQDFCVRLALMPHFAVQIENLAFAMPIQSTTPPEESEGRVVDI